MLRGKSCSAVGFELDALLVGRCISRLWVGKL